MYVPRFFLFWWLRDDGVWEGRKERLSVLRDTMIWFNLGDYLEILTQCSGGLCRHIAFIVRWTRFETGGLDNALMVILSRGRGCERRTMLRAAGNGTLSVKASRGEEMLDVRGCFWGMLWFMILQRNVWWSFLYPSAILENICLEDEKVCRLCGRNLQSVRRRSSFPLLDDPVFLRFVFQGTLLLGFRTSFRTR